MAFRKIPEHRLCDLPDEELIAYLVAAREAGDFAEARRALACFSFRRFDTLVGIALTKVGSREDAEDLAGKTIEDTIEANFKGVSPGEVVNLMKRILSRRIADHYEKQKREVETQVLPEELDDEKQKTPDAAISPDDKWEVLLDDATDRVLEDLSKPHRRVVDLRVYEGYSSKETAAIVNSEFPNLDTPMTDQNVDQIAHRFRKALRKELGED